MFRKLLVPLDFTKKNGAALEAACRLADPEDGELVLFHVIEEIERITSRELRAFYKKLEGQALKELVVLERRIRKTVPSVKHRVVVGHRGDEIVKYATENDVDLIVMSSRRMEADAPRAAWATISHVVAALAPCSTLLVK